MAGEGGDGPLGSLQIPGLHGRRELRGGALRGGKRAAQFADGVIAGGRPGVALLGDLEIVEGGKEREQARGRGSVQGQQGGGGHGEEAVERESRWPGANRTTAGGQ